MKERELCVILIQAMKYDKVVEYASLDGSIIIMSKQKYNGIQKAVEAMEKIRKLTYLRADNNVEYAEGHNDAIKEIKDIIDEATKK
jgi:hypothetical protein